MWEYYLAFWRQWNCFHGRARRSAYWCVVLAQALLLFGLMLLFQLLPLPHQVRGLASIYYIVALVPMISLQIRRLHDTGRSAWWMLLHFLGPIGVIVLLVFLCMDSDPGPNQYGPNPKALPHL